MDLIQVGSLVCLNRVSKIISCYDLRAETTDTEDTDENVGWPKENIRKTGKDQVANFELEVTKFIYPYQLSISH